MDFVHSATNLRVETLSMLNQKAEFFSKVWACETDSIRILSFRIIFEEEIIKHVEKDGKLMQHTCQMSLVSFVEIIIDIFNYSYYALLRSNSHSFRRLWNICCTATQEIILRRMSMRHGVWVRMLEGGTSAGCAGRGNTRLEEDNGFSETGSGLVLSLLTVQKVGDC